LALTLKEKGEVTMRPLKITIALSAILVALMVGSLFLTQAQTTPTKIRISWKPSKWILDTAVPPLWNASIAGVDPGLINPATIRATSEEGVGTPIAPAYTKVDYAGKDDLIASFLGNDMRNLIWQIVIHYNLLAAGRYRIGIKIYGNLNDGTPIEGVKVITIIVPEPPPPMP